MAHFDSNILNLLKVTFEKAGEDRPAAVGAFHLSGRLETGLVHLSDGATGDGFVLKLSEDVREGLVKSPLDSSAGGGARVRGCTGMEVGESIAHIAGKEILASCGPLAPLDERGASELQGAQEKAKPEAAEQVHAQAEWS
jgi:hypothetical protein